MQLTAKDQSEDEAGTVARTRTRTGAGKGSGTRTGAGKGSDTRTAPASGIEIKPLKKPTSSKIDLKAGTRAKCGSRLSKESVGTGVRAGTKAEKSSNLVPASKVRGAGSTGRVLPKIMSSSGSAALPSMLPRYRKLKLKPPSQPEPSFGGNKTIITPPADRTPTALVTSPLSDICDDIRGSGVGSDIDFEGDRTLQTDDLNPGPEKATSKAPNGTLGRSDSQKTPGGGGGGGSHDASCNGGTKENSSGLSRPSSAADKTVDLSSAINISAITNFISLSSAHAKPEELAAMIMKMSSAKTESRKAASSAGERAEGTQRVAAATAVATATGEKSTKGDVRGMGTLSSGKERNYHPDGKSDRQQQVTSQHTSPKTGAEYNHRSSTNGGRGLVRASSGEDLNSSSWRAPTRIPSRENIAVSNGNSSGATEGKKRPSPPPINGHTKIPVFQWNEQDDQRTSTEGENDQRKASNGTVRRETVEQPRSTKHIGTDAVESSYKNNNNNERHRAERRSSPVRRPQSPARQEPAEKKKDKGSRVSNQQMNGAQGNELPRTVKASDTKRSQTVKGTPAQISRVQQDRQQPNKDHPKPSSSDRNSWSNTSRTVDDEQSFTVSSSSVRRHSTEASGRSRFNGDVRNSTESMSHHSYHNKDRNSDSANASIGSASDGFEGQYGKDRRSGAEDNGGRRGGKNEDSRDSFPKEADGNSYTSSPLRWKSPRASLLMSTRPRREDLSSDSLLGDSPITEAWSARSHNDGQKLSPEARQEQQPQQQQHARMEDHRSTPKSADLPRSQDTSPATSSACSTGTVPTLLTKQSLLDTPFATQYLNSKSRPRAGAHTAQWLTEQDSIISDQLNALEDGTARPLQSVSILSDQLLPSDGQSTTSNTVSQPFYQSSSIVSDQWSPGKENWYSAKENYPPGGAKDQRQNSAGRQQQYLQTFPVPRNGLSKTLPTSFSSADQSLNPNYNSNKMPLSNTMATPRQLSDPRKWTPSIEVPFDVRLADVCCVGLSVQATLPLRNPSERWLQVALRVVSLEVDGVHCDPDRVIPFVFKEKVIIEPRTTEEVKIIFSPRQKGVYVAQLQALTSPVWSDQPSEMNCHVTGMVALQAIAENPNIQVLTKGARDLTFGTLPWGGQKGVHIFLINRGRAAVPVRLVIASNKSSAHCFTFEKPATSGDVSIISLSRPPMSASLAPSVANYTLPSATFGEEPLKPLPVTVYFHAPSHQMDRGHPLGPPDEFSARLDVEVDTPSSQILIGSLDMKAAVGTARLHAPRDMEMVEFSAEVGRSQSRLLPLRNAGNLELEVTLEVTHWPDLFSVSPPVLRLPPGAQHDVRVQFRPAHSSSTRFESLLLMFVEPGSAGYEISLCGEVLPSMTAAPTMPPHMAAPGRSLPRHLSTSVDGRGVMVEPTVMANKHFLAWGGVPLGRALQQSVSLQNNSDEPLRLNLQVRGDVDEFTLQSVVFGARRAATGETRELLLQPREDYTVHLLFAPSRVAHFSGKLQIKPARSATKYAIPLSGYGGVSSLTLEGVERGQTGSYWASVGPLTPAHPAVVRATVRNTGARAAFVKALCFRDLGGRQPFPIEGRLVVQPSEFCLQPDSTASVTVVLRPSETEAAMCLDQSSIVGTVVLFYGDEITRQKFRRALAKRHAGASSTNLGATSARLSDTNPVKGVNFDVRYLGEETVREMDVGPETPCDIELFYSTMARRTLALIGEPARVSAKDLQVAPLDGSEYVPLSFYDMTSRPVKGSRSSAPSMGPLHPAMGPPPSLPEKDLDVPGTALDESVVAVGPHPAPEDWYIKPERLVLNTHPKGLDSEVKRVQVVNCSEHPLRFELLWPGRVVTVTPDQGTVPPRSSTLVCVSASGALRSKGVNLPWKGHVQINSEGDAKVVKVQVREDVTMDDSPQPPGGALLPLAAEPGTPLLAVAPAAMQGGLNQQQQPDCLQLSQKTVHFPDTAVNRMTEMTLDMTNVSGQNVTWQASWFAPPYVKDHYSGPNGSVCRATYTVFKMPQHFGVLAPGQKGQITTYFSPREAGQYSQFWEIRSHTQGAHTAAKHTTKVELVGKGIVETATSGSDSLGQSSGTLLSLTTGTTRLQATLSKSDRGVTASPLLLDFPITKQNESSLLKVHLKNRDSEEHSLEVIAPKPPFKTKHPSVSVRGRHFVRVPVKFSPQHPGVYEGTLELRTHTGATISIRLLGTCRQ